MRFPSQLPVLAFVAAIIISPQVLDRYQLSVLILAGLYAIMSVGLNLLVGYTGQLSFGHNAFVGLGAYASAVLTTQARWPPLVALGGGLMATALVALLVGVPTLRLRGHYLAMATVALGIVGHVLFSELEPITKGFIGIGSIPALGLGPLAVDTDAEYFYLTWAIVLASVWLSQRIVSSRVGRALAAIRDNELAARSVGINATRYKIEMFVLSALLASIAGSVYAHWVTYVSPEPFGLDLAVLVIVILFVGGIGRLWAAPVGALLLTVVGEALRASKGLNQLVFGLIVVAVLLLAPHGLIGLGRSLVVRRDAARRHASARD